MKTHLIAAAFLMSAIALAQAPTAKIVRIIAATRMDSEVPRAVMPIGPGNPLGNNDEPGISLAVLVEGQAITGFKEGSLSFSKLESPGLKSFASKRATIHHLYTKVSRAGNHGSFTVHIPTDNGVNALDGLKVHGVVTVYIGGETQTGATVILPEADAAPVTVDDFKVHRNKTGGNHPWFGVTCTGPTEKIKDLIVTCEGKKLVPTSIATSIGTIKTTTMWYPIGTPGKPVSVQIVTWKSRTEVEVPFKYGK